MTTAEHARRWHVPLRLRWWADAGEPKRNFAWSAWGRHADASFRERSCRVDAGRFGSGAPDQSMREVTWGRRGWRPGHCVVR